LNLQDKTLYIRKKNETYLEVLAVDNIIMSLWDFFSFYVNGYQFMPKFRMKIWDGKLHLYNRNTCEIYVGLLQHIKEYAKIHEYFIEYTDGDLDIEDEFSVAEAVAFAKELKLHVKRKEVFVPIEPHDYQISAFRHAVQTKRCLLLSPTGSGKSAIIFMIIRYYQKIIKPERKILIIVPTVNLVHQLYTDFGEYSYADTWDVRDQVHLIYQGQDKGTDKQITITTWQSVYKLGIDYFGQFDVVVGDENHLFKATSLKGIMEKCYKAEYRFGTTGTLDESKTHKLVLEGLFGQVHKVTTTDTLIKQDILAQIEIICLMLYYPEEICKLMKNAKYHDEVSFLVAHQGRMKFVRNLVLSLKGNTLVLFKLVDKYGKILYESIKDKADSERKVFFISGTVPAEDREEFRKITESQNNAIIVASYGTFSVGANLRNLHNVILAEPAKSRIRVLQSIGRGLRKGEIKSKLNLYDISDVLQYKAHKNFTLKHFVKRMEIYNSEKFWTKIYKVKLK
jgi:superfamily II DNA or RNA helicase